MKPKQPEQLYDEFIDALRLMSLEQLEGLVNFCRMSDSCKKLVEPLEEIKEFKEHVRRVKVKEENT